MAKGAERVPTGAKSRSMRLRPILMLLCGLLLANALPAVADPAAETAAVKGLFSSPKIDPSTFTTRFVSKVPIDGIQGFVDSYKGRLGNPIRFDRDGTQLRIVSKGGSIGCDVALDQEGKISDLLFHDEMSAADLAALQSVMAAPKADPALFEKSFAADVPMTRVDDVIDGYRTKFGAFVRIEARKRGYYVVFEKGEAHAQISVTADGKIDYLAFTAA